MYIYRITNTKNGKCYIGQSIQESNVRLNNHKYLLKANRHSNPYLQSAWNFYGAESFVFEKIAFTNTTEELDALEKNIIKEYKSTNREFGYNIFSGGHHQHSVPEETRDKIGTANKGNKHTNEQKEKWAREKRIYDYSIPIVSPEGKEYIVDNVKGFAKEHGLEAANLRRVLQKKSYHVSGWRLITTPKEFVDDGFISFKTQSKCYGLKLISPEGDIYVIDKPLSRFCEEHNLRASHIRSVLMGNRNHHKGWKKYNN